MKDKSQVQISLFSKGLAAFDGLKKREQNLLIIMVPATIVLVSILLFIEPEFKASQRLYDSVSRLENQLELGLQSNNELLKQAKVDPNATVRQQIASLEQKLTELNAEFEGELNQLVSPQAMSKVLEELFNKAERLSLINMKSVAPEVLNANGTENGTGQQNNTNQQLIYRHGIEITFEGSFFATREFLSQAEALGWKLYWQELSYLVNEHPNAVTQMTLFTLSTSEAFISVN